jgi:hypothetical protein
MDAGGRRPDGPATKGGVVGALTGRLGFLALSVALAIALVASHVGWRQERADLRRSISELKLQGAMAQVTWKAQLAACNAEASPQRASQTGAAVSGDEAARRLLTQGPEGIDVCARMESADQAVLSTLK